MMSLVAVEQSWNLHLYLVRMIPIEQEVHRAYTEWLPLPGDFRSWESSERADNVWRLFIQILFR